MKTIIATTDYSNAANNALEYAAAIAGHVRAKLILFNAFHLAIPATPAPLVLPDITELIRDNELRLNAIGERLARQHGIEVSCHTSTALFKEELDKLVRHYQADLVVMGMRGESLSRKLFGSLTTTVLYHAAYPVLVVPESATHQGLLRILFACKRAYLTPYHNLGILQEIARAYKADVQVLHVETQEEMHSSDKGNTQHGTPNMEQLLRGIHHTYKFIADEDVISGIERGIEESKADLLVMVPHKADFWDTILNRSHTRRLALNTTIPLLALPNQTKKQLARAARNQKPDVNV
ncbi:universal stress protein [Cesiribacter andamanensis]|uniref:Universal stress protein UspG n=1 Tax=Cesiribacter andamanensis AMV16 TaxID=1279009 RepID=M7NQA9_9BACT|nr:universal stress protein [Cesiribacter andamanensis]EMR00704.1 universal stress protein UspG [Cesiribacter andamanensis AMV16]